MGAMFSNPHHAAQSPRHHAEKVLIVGLFYMGAAAAATAGAASHAGLANDVVMAAAGGCASALIGILVAFLVRRLVSEPGYRAAPTTSEPVRDLAFAATRPKSMAVPSASD